MKLDSIRRMERTLSSALGARIQRLKSLRTAAGASSGKAWATKKGTPSCFSTPRLLAVDRVSLATRIESEPP